MNTVFTKYRPGDIYDLRSISDSSKVRMAGGVHYVTAIDLLNSKAPSRSGVIGAENGAFELDTLDGFELFDGQARRTSDKDVTSETVCYQLVADAVADAADWRWIKLSIRGGAFDGYGCLGVHNERQEAVLVEL